jgi:hypothetical protein
MFEYLVWGQLTMDIVHAGLLNAWGQLGPAEIPPKREYILKDVMRKAHSMDRAIQVKCPPSHPFRPLLPLRAVCCPLYVGKMVGHFGHSHISHILNKMKLWMSPQIIWSRTREGYHCIV